MEYQIRQTSFDEIHELEQLVKLQNIVYKDRNLKFTTYSFKHWYIDNPLGKVLSFSAFMNDDMIAHYACIPVQMKIDNRIVNGIHSMATVTHPDYRGRGLFKQLARLTYEYAEKIGYEFVIGVANANSFHGFMKYFPFTFVGRLEVKFGFGKILNTDSEKIFRGYWTENRLMWRLNKSKYSVLNNSAYGIYKNMPFVCTFMGVFAENTVSNLSIKKKSICRPFNLYIGIGADLSKGHYYNLPRFIKHSPFNLIFMDLTNGKLPSITRDNILFQLIDFDVA